MAAPGAGSVVALVTPMTSDNKIDYPKLVELLEWHVKAGTDGAVILGTTGESSTITNDERTEIIKTSVATVKGGFPIIVGTGTIDPNKVIELCRNAKDLGADASLIITPYYIKPPQRALVTHFRSIADAVALPLIAYNCPGRTGVDMKPETVAQIASHPNIIGLKDATGDQARVKLHRDLCGKGFLLYRYVLLHIFVVVSNLIDDVYSGEDDQGCEFVGLGGDGVISVTANVAPGPMHE